MLAMPRKAGGSRSRVVTCGLSLRVWRVGLSWRDGGGKTRIAQARLESMRGRGGSGHGNKEPRDLVRVLLAV